MDEREIDWERNERKEEKDFIKLANLKRDLKWHFKWY